METKILNIIKSGGAIVLAAILALMIYQFTNGLLKALYNDLEHIGGYIEKNTEVITEVKGALEANTTQLKRVEEVLDRKL